MAVYGKDDLRGLDKSKLWCSVQSRQGSLDLVFCLAVLGVVKGAAHRSHLGNLERRAGNDAYLEGGCAGAVFVVAGKRGGHRHYGSGFDQRRAYLTTLIHLADGLV